VTFDLAAVSAFDTAGATLLLVAEEAHGGPVRLEHAGERMEALLDRLRPATKTPPPPPPASAFTYSGVLTGWLRYVSDRVAFLGESTLALLRLPVRRRIVRSVDLLRLADQAGVQAIPLVLLLGVLMGLILAFQSIIPLRRFGADIFVANLVALSLLRELGPLLAAIILAGRTGSAFAAEIGTMKVNEEVDALVTLGLDPVTMLVLPRLIAATLVMPALTLALEAAGLVGMILVLMSFGFPLVAITNQVARSVRIHDFVGGLFKALVFGAVVAAIGCRAVGMAATSAVVGGIVATVLLDGVFALLYFRLGV
jgi:phospholipid/cholesterol/gamma-HCH transport system permease protein